MVENLLPFILQTSDEICNWLEGIDLLREKTKEEKQVDISLYSGLAGNLFYLIEVYKITKDPNYLHTIINICDKLKKWSYKDRQLTLSLYLGLGGIIFIFSEVYLITLDESYLDFAKTIIKENVNNSNDSCDILRGKAGEIIALLLFYNCAKEEWILNEIKIKIDFIISHAVVSDKGLCWNIVPGETQPLCGFSHGASGIAYMFLTLGRNFNNKNFYWLAKQAFNYENDLFNTEIGNWPDFRQDVYSENAIETISLQIKYNNAIVIEPRYLSFWCHGAPGIGMAHLHAYSAYMSDNDLYYFKKSKDNVISSIDKMTDYSLCHGICGNATIFIDEYIILQKNDINEIAKKVAMKCVNERHSFNPSLFLGITGVAYYCLRLLFPKKVFSILTPSINIRNSHDKLPQYNIPYFIKIFTKNEFTNTSCIIPEKFYDDYTYNYNQTIFENISNNINIHCKKIGVSDFTIERRLDALRQKIIKINKNYSYLIAYEYKSRQCIKLNPESINTNNISINRFAEILKIFHNGGYRYFLTKAIYYFPGVSQFEIDELTYKVINSFDIPKRKIKSFENLFPPNALNNQDFLKMYNCIFYDCIEKSYLILLD